MSYYLGIDVGTGSARAAVITDTGELKAHMEIPIETYHPSHNIYEQSSINIWSSICKAVHCVTKDLAPENIKGIGFDATCSLVVLDKEGTPQSVDQLSDFTNDQWNIILWADHRAIEQANRINQSGHPVLQYVGNTISPEMEIPKTLWLKETLPEKKWNNIGHLMDLPDYLTYRATGSLARSTCSLTCKYSYLPRGVTTSVSAEEGWDAEYFKLIGLECLVDEDWKRLGGRAQKEDDVLHAGDRVGNGLTEQAASELGLLAGTPVGSAVIDAYAGAIATLSASSSDVSSADQGQEILAKRLAIICGTSSCHISMSPKPIFVPGVWGPYHSVLIPGMWCAEGGQSSTGQLLDYILKTHPAYHEANQIASNKGWSIHQFMEQYIAELQTRSGAKYADTLTQELHIYPDFHGNRSPLADPSLRGSIVGVTLDQSIDDLALRYLATLQAIACQTRHIMESMNQRGYTIDTLCLSGGLSKNRLFIQIQADVAQCKVILPYSVDASVVIGAAILGAKAADDAAAASRGDNGASSLWQTMCRLSRAGSGIQKPRQDSSIRKYYENRYLVFHEMLKDQLKYRDLMK